MSLYKQGTPGKTKKIDNKCNQLLFRRHPKKSYFCPINVPTRLAFQSSLCDNGPIAVPAEENCYCPNSPFVALMHESVSGSNQLFPAISEFGTPPAVHFFFFFPCGKNSFCRKYSPPSASSCSVREIWLWQLCWGERKMTCPRRFIYLHLWMVEKWWRKQPDSLLFMALSLILYDFFCHREKLSTKARHKEKKFSYFWEVERPPYQEMYPSSFFVATTPLDRDKKIARNNTRFWGPKRQKKRKILQKKFHPSRRLFKVFGRVFLWHKNGS